MEQYELLSGLDRRQNIIEYLEQHQEASAKELADLYHVSVMTIRRDFHVLEEIGIADIHYGGARIRKERILLPSFSRRDQQDNRMRRSIGKMAASYLKEGDSIFMDVSTTVFYMTQYFPDIHMTVITNSMPVMERLTHYPKIRLLIAPGTYNADIAGTCDLSTVEYIQRYHVNKSFIGTMACNVKYGICSSNEMEAALKYQMWRNADESFLLADHTKFHATGPIIHNKISDFSHILTDYEIDADMEAAIKKENKQFIVCPA